MKSIFAAAIALACLSFAGAASAETGYISSGVNLRAGPGTEFPRITTLQRGRQVDVRGCLRTQEWCDIEFRGGRGWVSARYLDINYQGRRQGYWSNRQRARIPTSSWDMNTYWDENYRNQNFNRDRNRYRQYGPRSEPTSARDDRGNRNGRDDDRMQNDDRNRSDGRDDRGRDGAQHDERGQNNNQMCDDARTPARENCPQPPRR